MSPLEDHGVDNGLVFRGRGLETQEQLKAFRRQLGPASLERLAQRLEVTAASLEALDCGFARHAYTFPMRDADGEIIGFALRTYKDGGKRVIAGSRNGLFVPRQVTPGNVQLIVEGPSDTAAAWTREFAAIGRSGAHEAIDLAVGFVAKAANACPCVVGDNDPDGTGRAGADAMVAALLAAGVPCRLLMPPDEFADLRDWLTRGQVDAETLAAEIEPAKVAYPRDWPPGFTGFPHGFTRSGGLARLAKKQPRALTVLMAIGSFADGNGVAFLSREQIAELAGGTSVKTVDRCKEALREEGLLDWLEGHTDKANTYFLKLGPYRGAVKLKRRVRPALRFAPREPTPQEAVQKGVVRLAKHLDPSYCEAIERKRDGREREPKTHTERMARFLGAAGRGAEAPKGSR
ncbi:MAG: hypothetical protein R6X20_09525 [Phycisphaerae bacterium]